MIVQPHSLAQDQKALQADERPITEQIMEGGGFTRDPSKISKNEYVTFAADQSFDQATFEDGFAVPEEPMLDPSDSTADDTAIAPTAIIGVNPSLPGGVDHAAAGTGTRNTGYGTIRLRGVPAGATIVRAWLYWGTVYRNPAPSSATARFNGSLVTGRRIGAPTPEPCWLFQNASFAAYRANVRPLIVAGANGDYKVTNLASVVTNGTDPFVCAPPFPTPATPASEGATLLVIYSHSSVPSAARTYIHQGPALVTGNVTVTNNLSPLVPAHTVVKQTRFGADGQVGCSLFSVGFLNGEMTSLGPNAASLVQIKGPGSGLNTNSDWNGYDGVSLNQLWDTQTDAFGSVNGQPNIIPNGVGQYVVLYTGVGDCFVTVAHVLTVK
jgi:hypothetical protein